MITGVELERQRRAEVEASVREGLPPVDDTSPAELRAMIAAFAAAEINLVEFAERLDEVGHEVEAQLSRRGIDLAKEWTSGVRRGGDVLDELTVVLAWLRWLRGAPRHGRWQQVAFVLEPNIDPHEHLHALERLTLADERWRRIATAASGTKAPASNGDRVDRGTPRPRSGPLTSRKTEVLALIAAGHTHPEIAVRLGIAECTVDTHRLHLKQKLDADTRADLFAAATERGLA